MLSVFSFQLCFWYAFSDIFFGELISGIFILHWHLKMYALTVLHKYSVSQISILNPVLTLFSKSFSDGFEALTTLSLLGDFTACMYNLEILP